MSTRSLRRADRRGLAVVAGVAFVAALSAATLRTVSNLNVPGDLDADRFALADFRDAVYYPVVSFLDGNNPYDPQTFKRLYPVESTFPLYSPATLLVHVPFALVPLTVAEWIFYALGVCLLVALAREVLRGCDLAINGARVLGLTALLIASRPGQSALFLGQYAPEMTLATVLAVSGRVTPRIAAIGLAFATIKPSFGVPVAIVLLAAGAWRTVAAGAAIAAAGAAIPLVVLLREAGGVARFVESLSRAHAHFASVTFNRPESSPTRLDAPALVARAAEWHSPALEAAIGVALIAVAALAVRRLGALPERERTRLVSSIACLAALCSVYHQPYDGLLLALPLTAAATRRLLPSGVDAPWSAAALPILLAIPAVNYVASFRAFDALQLGAPAERILSCANGAALGAAFAICVATAWRRPSLSGAEAAPAAIPVST